MSRIKQGMNISSHCKPICNGMKPKQNVKGDTDLEDFDFDDYDEDEGDGLSDEEQEDEEA